MRRHPQRRIYTLSLHSSLLLGGGSNATPDSIKQVRLEQVRPVYPSQKGQHGIGWWAIEIRLAMVDRALAASSVRWLLAVDARDAAGIGKSTERRQRPARLYVRGEERVGRLIPVDYSSVTNSSP